MMHTTESQGTVTAFSVENTDRPNFVIGTKRHGQTGTFEAPRCKFVNGFPLKVRTNK